MRIALTESSWVWLERAFLPDPEAFERLRSEVAFAHHHIRLFGKSVAQPRLSAWMGTPDAVYTYSGLENLPAAVPPTLEGIQRTIEDETGRVLGHPVRFNGVLANLYRDGRDSMGWHADDEPELGPRPIIASLSLGAPRRFLLRHRRDKQSKFAWELGNGDLLIMAGDTQAEFLHALPKTQSQVGPRINLTFRTIQGSRT